MVSKKLGHGPVKVARAGRGVAEELVLRLAPVKSVEGADVLAGGPAAAHERTDARDGGGVGRRVIADPSLFVIERGDVVRRSLERDAPRRAAVT